VVLRSIAHEFGLFRLPTKQANELENLPENLAVSAKTWLFQAETIFLFIIYRKHSLIGILASPNLG